ncbi:DUF1772-domain-containing protein [Delitschia confertaspora ATCC 74209]|uniref:DUF1772-domain-containing protein n=1 Tax=Delitschia confertaspora ATCC 74209 TaxID=1513339 RepID=A0A9P4JBS6_9PLEO|nr:DUF1772-domain-containing protein [Delitschia confertaspora ATCC 74209]
MSGKLSSPQKPAEGPVLALLAGCFLSGAMTGLSLIAVPVLLDTNTSATHLATQWARMYHYGHTTMPAMAIATMLLYGYAARSAKKAGNVKWRRFLTAGATTLVMIPFTWFVMAPTNNKLSGMAVQGGRLDVVRGLVEGWKWLHYARSVFPLAGALVGLTAVA